MDFLYALLAIYTLAMIVFAWICFAPAGWGLDEARWRPDRPRGRRRTG